MKLAPIAQNLLEWVALKAGVVPTPLAWSHFGHMMSRVISEAVDKGIFEAIGTTKTSMQDIAVACKFNKEALQNLLPTLASMQLVSIHKDEISLTKMAKKWLLKESPQSLYWLIMFDHHVCYNWMEKIGDYLTTGKGLQYHETFTEQQWYYYQKAMYAMASSTAREAARKIRLPASATSMLDIGGAHGLYSIALSSKSKHLKATVFDLPGAVQQASTMHSDIQSDKAISYVSGNILTDDIGTNKYDIILLASVAHHFSEADNKLVAHKAFAALKPGGQYIIMEVIKPNEQQVNKDMLAAFGNLFFALSSTSGLWTADEIKNWQQKAGFTFYRTTTFLTIPGYKAIISKKPL